MNINKVVLMGRLTSDPELKTSATNVSVVQFSIAVNRRFSKEGQKNVDFIECSAFNKNADFLAKYFRKGSSVIVFGNIQVDSWKDKDGNNRKSVRVIVDELQFGESKNKDQNNAGTSADASIPTATNADFFADVTDADAQLPF